MSKTAPVLVTFARPEESIAFRRRLSEPRKRAGSVSGLIEQTPVTVIHTGIGPAAAHRSISKVLSQERWSWVACAGFAGGLDPRLRVADTLIERITGTAGGRLVSRPEPVESIEAKRALYLSTGAAAVDMETATISAVALAAGVPIVAVRVISDTADTPLPVPFPVWFDLDRQRPRVLALLVYLARHPGKIGGFARFVRGLGPAQTALASAVERCIRRPEAEWRFDPSPPPVVSS